ncbi:MAG: hypothetical protein QOH79_3640 [Acidimicrobiaceae bacterium]
MSHGGIEARDKVRLYPGRALTIPPADVGLKPLTVVLRVATGAAAAQPGWVEIARQRVDLNAADGDGYITFGPVQPDDDGICIALSGDWPPEVEPPELVALTAGGAPVAMPARLGSDDPPPLTYFTSFEETGIYYFLSYIPWIYNRSIVTGPPLQQSSTFALSGIYSALFGENITGTSALETQNLPIPTGTALITLGGWVYVKASNVTIGVHLTIDGQDNVRSWRFANDDIGTWVYRRSSVSVPAGAQIFYGWIKLDPNSQLSSNGFYLDDYGVDFIPVLSPGRRQVVVGDIGGNVYGLGLQTGTPAWTAAPAQGVVGWAPAIAGGVAYVATSGSTAALSAVETGQGITVWTTPLPAPVRSQPAVFGGLVMVCGADGVLRAYATANGSAQWQVDVIGLTPGRRVSVNGAVLVGTVLYLSTDVGVAAVDITRQRVLWRAQQGLAFPYPAAVAQGLVFAGAKDGGLYALSAGSGQQAWVYDTGEPVQCEPQVVGGVVLFGSDDGVFYGLQAATGALQWTLSPPGATAVRSFLYESGILYVASNAVNGAFSAYQLSVTGTGTWTWSLKWSKPLVNGAQADPAIVGDRVFLTTSSGSVTAYSIVDGSTAWTYQPSRVAFAGPAIAAAADPVDNSRRFDQVCWLGSHNAYANSEDGWWYAQQSKSIIRQLDDGVRMLMVDVWNCPTSGADRVVYAHEGCTLSWLMAPFASFVSFADSLAEIADWLRRNPSEIVTLILEQRVGNRALLQAAITASGAADLFFYADRTNTGPSGTWNVRTQGWPPLAWMIAANLRLVVFSDRGWGTPYRGDDGLPFVWDWTVENDYGDASANGKCQARPGSRALANNPPALFIANYNTTFSVNSPDLDGGPYYPFDSYNDFTNIMGIVDGCWGLVNRLPNFLAVDWYDFGDNGGPRQAVAEINARWARTT